MGGGEVAWLPQADLEQFFAQHDFSDSQREFGKFGGLDGLPDLTTISAGGSHSTNKGGARSWTSE